MSSDPELERLLRDAGGMLPAPDENVSRRSRSRALDAARARRPRRVRVAALVGSILVLAVGLGIGIGALVTPSGEAAKTAVGLGFLPEPGWFAFQTGAEVNPLFQTIAVAANVPLDPEDRVSGQASSGLPYETLLALPPDGIVIQASFTRRAKVPEAWISHGFPVQKLPLRLRDASPYVQSGTQIRPDEPLGQYQLRAEIDDFDVDLLIYFGTSSPSAELRAEAQRQLDRLVVDTRPDETPTDVARRERVAAPAVLDRTFACTPGFVGGIYKLEPHAQKGTGRRGSTWNQTALVGLSTSVSGASVTALDNEIVWLTAGRPSSQASLVPTFGNVEFAVRAWGTAAVNRRLCRASKAKVPLSRKGLRGGAPDIFETRWDCATPRRVLVRVRATLESRSTLTSFRSFVRTTVPVVSAQLGVATTAGKALAYAQVDKSGKATLFTAKSCVED